MYFPHIDGTLEVCRRHLARLDDTLPDSVEIESLLVSSIVLLIVSHYESHVAEQFAERAARSGDREVTNFVTHHTARRFRSPNIGKITAALGEFGREYRERFTRRVENTRAHAFWDNIIRARHGIVHQGVAANMTLRELETAYRESHEVLAALRSSLGLSDGSASPNGGDVSSSARFAPA